MLNFYAVALPIYSIQELNNFIDRTQKKYKDTIADIIFFGGEPTLNYEFIDEIIVSQSELKEIPYEFHYMLHTNGLLLHKLPHQILQVIDSIMLSVNYDKIPRYQLDSGYFKTIIDAVHFIRKEKNIPIIARLTITEETSLYSEIALLSPFFDAIYWQIENKYAFKDYEKFYSSYQYELKLAFGMWLQYLKNGVLIKFIPFIATTYFMKNQTVLDFFCCGYNKSMIYVQTNGQCYTCAEDMSTQKNLIGSISSDIEFDTFGIKDTQCHSCIYLNMCLGRCGRMHKEFLEEHIEEYCKLNHVLFNLIKENYVDILKYCDKYNITLELNESIYHYTEYTP